MWEIIFSEGNPVWDLFISKPNSKLWQQEREASLNLSSNPRETKGRRVSERWGRSLSTHLCLLIGFIQVAPVVKNPPDSAGDVRDACSIPGSGRSPGGGHGSPLQYSCLENPMDREAWGATVHRVSKSWTQLKQFSDLPFYRNRDTVTVFLQSMGWQSQTWLGTWSTVLLDV